MWLSPPDAEVSRVHFAYLAVALMVAIRSYSREGGTDNAKDPELTLISKLGLLRVFLRSLGEFSSPAIIHSNSINFETR